MAQRLSFWFPLKLTKKGGGKLKKGHPGFPFGFPLKPPKSGVSSRKGHPPFQVREFLLKKSDGRGSKPMGSHFLGGFSVHWGLGGSLGARDFDPGPDFRAHVILTGAPGGNRCFFFY